MKQFIRFSSRGAVIAAGVAITTAAFAARPDPDLGVQGDPASYDRVITIKPDTKSVNAERNENVKFIVASNGQSFTWKFDTLKTKFPLESVAPHGTLNGRHVEAYVEQTADGD